MITSIDTLNNRVGIGTISPDATLEILNTSTQLILSHSDPFDVLFTVGSTGALTILPTDSVTIDSALAINGLETINGVLGTTLTGTVSVTAATAAVTGSGTDFEGELVEGSAIEISGEVFTVSTIISANSLTLDSNHIAGATSVIATTDGTILTLLSNDGGTLTSISSLGIIGNILSDVDSNTKIGTQSLLKLTTGFFNTMMGHFTGKSITTGVSNVSIGSDALGTLTSGT